MLPYQLKNLISAISKFQNKEILLNLLILRRPSLIFCKMNLLDTNPHFLEWML